MMDKDFDLISSLEPVDSGFDKNRLPGHISKSPVQPGQIDIVVVEARQREHFDVESSAGKRSQEFVMSPAVWYAPIRTGQIPQPFGETQECTRIAVQRPNVMRREIDAMEAYSVRLQ